MLRNPIPPICLGLHKVAQLVQLTPLFPLEDFGFSVHEIMFLPSVWALGITFNQCSITLGRTPLSSEVDNVNKSLFFL